MCVSEEAALGGEKPKKKYPDILDRQPHKTLENINRKTKINGRNG